MLLRSFCCIVLLLAPSLAGASTICVDTGGSGGCFSTVQAAVDVASPGDVIEVAAGTYLENVAVPTPKRVTIQGAGAGATIIQADGLGPAVEARAGTRVSVIGVTITGGRDGITAEDQATIALASCDVSGNARIGIAISRKGRGTVTGCTVTGNGAIGIEGGGRLAISSSTVSGNNVGGAPFGGGVYSVKSLRIDDSTIRDNHGWGVNLYRSAQIRRTTISGNEDGGVTATGRFGVLKISDTTISGNAGFAGGGIYTDQRAILDHVTIAGNTASSSGGGLSVGPHSRVSVEASILADNAAPIAPDCSTMGLVRTITANLVEDTSGCSFAPGSVAPLTADPLLGPLQNNGGPTETRALGVGSPALGVVTRTAQCSLPDQRGVARALPCDLGAYEAS